MERDYDNMNLFMVCRRYNRAAAAPMPEGFSLDMCRRDELDVWKMIHFDRDAESFRPFMDQYFRDVYAAQEELFFSKRLFVRNAQGRPVGTGFVWKAYGKVNTIHWFKVLREYEGRGIGRALMTAMMSELAEPDFPVCIHTQPPSNRAIKLYTDFGFELITDARVGMRDNHLKESLPYLKKTMTEAAYRNLKFTSAPVELLEAAASSPVSEF